MDAFELLKADHKKVAELFDQLDAASGKAKLNVFQQIKSELELHANIEETIFYPALEEPDETHDLILEAYEEHEMVKTLLAELDGAESADDQWQAKAKVLRENVEHHVDEEENELFDKAEDALSDEQIESLGERMEVAKAQAQGRPAPTRAVTTSSKSSKSSTAKPGILTKIANLVGLGGEPSKKRAAKKALAKKKPAARKGTKITAKPASRKASKKPGSKKGGKSRVATVRKGASAGSKKASASRSTGTRKRSSTGSGKKAAKSRARGK